MNETAIIESASASGNTYIHIDVFVFIHMHVFPALSFMYDLSE